MTGVLTLAELFIASLIERFLIFWPRYQPGDLDVLIKRQLWLQRMKLPRMVVAPNHFRVTLDAETYLSFQPVLEPLSQELAVSLETYCQQQGFRNLGPFCFEFKGLGELRRGQVRIECHIVQEGETR